MAISLINTGTVANDGTGDSLRVASLKINSNFQDLDGRLDEVTTVGKTGNYNDLINLPSIPVNVRDLQDPFQDLEQVRGTITSSLITDGGLYSVGTESQTLRIVYATELNAGLTAELNLIGDSGVAIDSGNNNTIITANVLSITTQGQISVSAQQLDIVGQVNANVSGNITASDGTSLINAADSGEIVGPINTSNDAVFSGNVDLTDATVTGLPAAFSGSYNDLTDTPTLFSGSYNDLTDTPTLFSGSYNDLTDTPTLFSGSYNDLTDQPTIVDYSTDISGLQGRVTAVETLLGAVSTNVVQEGTNNSVGESSPGAGDGTNSLYFTETRARAAISSSGDISYDPNTGIISYTSQSVPTTVAELTDSGNYLLITDLQTIAAASTDFADFQARIAAL